MMEQITRDAHDEGARDSYDEDTALLLGSEAPSCVSKNLLPFTSPIDLVMARAFGSRGAMGESSPEEAVFYAPGRFQATAEPRPTGTSVSPKIMA